MADSCTPELYYKGSVGGMAAISLYNTTGKFNTNDFSVFFLNAVEQKLDCHVSHFRTRNMNCR